MRRDAISTSPSLVILVLGGLAGLNAFVWWSEIDTSSIAPPPMSALAPPHPVGVARDAAMPPLSSFAETLARPLFQPDRRPLQAMAAAAAPEPARPLPAPEGLRVLGVMQDALGASRALVATPKAAHGTWLAVGDKIEGWTVAGIGPAGITLAAGRVRHELPLFVPPATPVSVRK